MREEAVLFGEFRSLVGIVTEPTTQHPHLARQAVILLNPGIVHRVGPGRIYVKIARALAKMGFVILRFDLSGIGDSAVRHDTLPFEKGAVSDARQAMDVLQSEKGIDQFILLGGCSGAVISLETACQDPRVIGAILINFPVNQEEEETADQLSRKAAHYYLNFAFFNLKSWRKLLTGRANYQKLLGTVRFHVKHFWLSRKSVSDRDNELATKVRILAERGIGLSFLYSDSDIALRDLREALGNELTHLAALGKVVLKAIPRADHTFSSLYDQERLLQLIPEQIEFVTSNKHHASLPGIARTSLLPLNIGDSPAQS